MSSGNTRKLSAEITEIKEAERRKEKRTIRNKINIYKINKKKSFFFSYMKGNIRNIIWKGIIYDLDEINKN